MLARGGDLRVPLYGDHEEIIPPQIEAVAVAVSNLMALGRADDQSGDTLGVEGPMTDPHNAAVEGPVRGDPTGHEGVEIGAVKNGMGVDGGERYADDWKAALIGSVAGRTEGVRWHDVLRCCFSHRDRS